MTMTMTMTILYNKEPTVEDLSGSHTMGLKICSLPKGFNMPLTQANGQLVAEPLLPFWYPKAYL